MKDDNSPFTTHQLARRIGKTEIVLESQSWSAGGPSGGVVWNRPAAVRVRDESGETRLPIIDVTRRRQIALYSISLLFMVAGLLLGGRPTRE